MKKGLALIMLVMMAVSILGGCQKKQESKETVSKADVKKDSETKATKETDNKKTAEPVTLRYMWWGGDSRHEATLAAIKKYEELHPEVNIKPEYMGYSGYYEKLVTQLAGGTAADVLQVNVPWLIDIMKGGDLLVDLHQQETVNLADYDSKFLQEFCEYDGKLVGVPNGINAKTMFANTKFFDAVGVKYDQEWTWNSMLKEGEALHQAHEDKYLLNQDIKQVFQFVAKPYLYQMTGKELILDDKSLGMTEEDLAKTFDYIQQLYVKGVLQPASETMLYTANENPKWINGHAGLQADWPATLYRYMYDETELDVLRLPVHEEAASEAIAMKATMLTSVNNNSENKEEALAFLDWFMNDEEAIKILKDVRGVPASSKAQQVLVDSDTLNPLMIKAIDFGLANPFPSESGYTNSSDVKTIFNEAIELLAYSETTPEEAAKEVYARLNEYLD